MNDTADLASLPDDSLDLVRTEARQALDQLRAELLRQRTPTGYWTGTLSPSALSTATAISALAAVLISEAAGGGDLSDATEHRTMIDQGIGYLGSQQNDDGGFGDTDRSHSNIATSYLVLAASTLAGKVGQATLLVGTIDRLNSYLDQAGRLDGLRERYGADKTFVVPIMNNLAIAGLISWDDVAALPFEAAVFPQSMYRFLQMPVVSYAIPALVAIGQARHFLGRRTFLPWHFVRGLCVRPTLKVLRRMQPCSGGYLEATPLTAFVVMSLAATGRTKMDVVEHGLRFLHESMQPNGSWPIDTNLETWVTSLSIQALACDPQDNGDWYSDSLAEWHLDCQHRQRHPFTGAEPGGWGWADFSGAVPDSDDTPAAILALDQMRRFASPEIRQRMADAVNRGIGWLLKLQNRNGGWPTFCRGWGKLPFDRSSTDLTAHAMRAIDARKPENELSPPQFQAIQAGKAFLDREQASNGSWTPLWFGNQDRDDETNPIYGTAKVLLAPAIDDETRARGVDFLLTSQNADGGWGGGPSVTEKIQRLSQQGVTWAGRHPITPAGLISSVEETALALDALATYAMSRCVESANSVPLTQFQQDSEADEQVKGLSLSEMAEVRLAGGNEAVWAAILSGVKFLTHSIRDGRHQVAWPIGFYFAKLWYHEQLYPIIFSTAALGKFMRAAEQADSSSKTIPPNSPAPR